MVKKNIIVLSIDEVRPDHLGCYGYEKPTTPAIDSIAQGGVKFKTCITSANLTPIAMGSVTTGNYPNKHGMRDPFSTLSGPSIGTIFKDNGYATAGFVGNGLLSKENGFAQGFDFWNEPTEETIWGSLKFDGTTEFLYEGNYWVEEFFEWFKNNNTKKPFFVWGHFYETHEGSEHVLLEKGLLKEGELSEFSYYDAKIKLVDTNLISRLLKTLDEAGIADDTTLVIVTDHGTNLGDHPAGQLPWRKERKKYPQHTSMFDCVLKVALIIKGEGFPAGKEIDGMARTIDILPTLLDVSGISPEKYDFDGKSLMPAVKSGRTDAKKTYAESLFDPRPRGFEQAIRTEDFKYIRSLKLGVEEYYNLKEDAEEKNNIIDTIDKDKLIEMRKELNSFLESRAYGKKTISKDEKEKINQRLRALGYIK